MNRRTFLKMMAALGAVPSLGMLKPVVKPEDPMMFYQINWNNPIYVSEYAKDFYLPSAEAGRQFAEHVQEHREQIDRDIIRSLDLAQVPGDQRGER